MKRVHYEGVPFGGHNPPHIKNPKWGTPNLQKIGSRTFIYSILS